MSTIKENELLRHSNTERVHSISSIRYRILDDLVGVLKNSHAYIYIFSPQEFLASICEYMDYLIHRILFFEGTQQFCLCYNTLTIHCKYTYIDDYINLFYKRSLYKIYPGSMLGCLNDIFYKYLINAIYLKQIGS